MTAIQNTAQLAVSLPALELSYRMLDAQGRWRKNLVASATLLACLSTASPGSASAAPAGAGLDCLIQPSQTVQVGTATAGVIQIMRVERGDYVRRGQTLVQMDSRVERAALAVAREKADALGEARATSGASELAQRELERAADLVKENFVSRTFYDRQRAEVQVASGRGQQAQERLRLADREVQLASAQLAQRTVTSPVDGVVVERHVNPGEYVEQKPVLRIAQIDPLRVDVLVPAAIFGQINAGDKAQVTPELINKQARPATVTGVDRVIDAASNTFRVRLELANPGGKLPPGLRCKADLVATPVTGPKPEGMASSAGSSVPAKWATQTLYESTANSSHELTPMTSVRPQLQLTWAAQALVRAAPRSARPPAVPADVRPDAQPARLTVAAVR